MIGVASGENLRLGFEAAESTRMNDAVAVPRIVAAIRMGQLRVTAPAGGFRMHGPRGQRGRSCDGPLHLAPEKRARFEPPGTSGLRRNRFQPAVGLFRDIRVRKLSLNLLVNVGRFLDRK